MVMVHVHHLSMVRLSLLDLEQGTNILPAEFRGPGVRHQFDDSGDEYELDLNQRSKGFGGRSGRIILLGDGTEVLTDSDDTEMFDHSEEDKDLDNQVKKGEGSSDDDSKRSAREQTPGPQPASDAIPSKLVASPAEDKSENPVVKAASDGPAPKQDSE